MRDENKKMFDNDRKRIVWLVTPQEPRPIHPLRPYAGFQKAVVIAKTAREAKDLVFQGDVGNNRFKVKVESIGECPHSFHSWVVCFQFDTGNTYKIEQEDKMVGENLFGFPEDKMAQLRRDVAAAFNRVSFENLSDTPDFILADVAIEAVLQFSKSVNRRESYYKNIPTDDKKRKGETI